ncbi:MAG: tetratricopeptide repeat protein [Bacteroides sp.]|nr:tetratricopeptide repeat protein [Bacteroides sp.]
MLATVSFFAAAQGIAELDTWRKQIYEAYVLNNMPQWARTVRLMETAYARQPSGDLLYELTLAQYGLIGYYLGEKENGKAEVLLDKAEKNSEALSKIPGYRAEAYAFESAFIGFRIGLRPIRAVTQGPRSMRAADNAIETDDRYARAWVEKGNISFFAPAPFGSKTDAISHYEKAIQLMEANMHPAHRWLYLSTLVSLAGAYEKTGDLPHAIRTLEKALRFEPRFKWVKDEMLPKYKALQAAG